METHARTWVAAFQNRNLRMWETTNGYLWKVTNTDTDEIISQGEALSREDAMIDAAQAAGADWGSARWSQQIEDTRR